MCSTQIPPQNNPYLEQQFHTSNMLHTPKNVLDLTSSRVLFTSLQNVVYFCCLAPDYFLLRVGSQVTSMRAGCFSCKQSLSRCKGRFQIRVVVNPAQHQDKVKSCYLHLSYHFLARGEKKTTVQQMQVAVSFFKGGGRVCQDAARVYPDHRADS